MGIVADHGRVACLQAGSSAAFRSALSMGAILYINILIDAVPAILIGWNEHKIGSRGGVPGVGIFFAMIIQGLDGNEIHVVLIGYFPGQCILFGECPVDEFSSLAIGIDSHPVFNSPTAAFDGFAVRRVGRVGGVSKSAPT